MLIKLEHEGQKLKATHVERVDGNIRYCQELAKDSSNGFTKQRTMRRIGNVPNIALLAYAQEHPDWWQRAFSPVTQFEKNRAWRDFFKSEIGRPYLTVEKILHS
jgi:hypothetical protein